MSTASVSVTRPSDRSRLALAAVMLFMGALHFVAPGPFERLIPRWLGNPRFHVYWSGAAELAAGVLLIVPKTRRTGALVALTVFVLVFPGNISMAVAAGRPHDVASWLAWLRLPLQIPLWRWAWKVSQAASVQAD